MLALLFSCLSRSSDGFYEQPHAEPRLFAAQFPVGQHSPRPRQRLLSHTLAIRVSLFCSLTALRGDARRDKAWVWRACCATAKSTSSSATQGRALGRLHGAGTTLQICDQRTGVPQALSHRLCLTQGRRPAMEDCYVALAGPEAILARGGEVILIVLPCVLCMENH